MSATLAVFFGLVLASGWIGAGVFVALIECFAAKLATK